MIRKQLPVHPRLRSQAFLIVLKMVLEHPWVTAKLERDDPFFAGFAASCLCRKKASTFACLCSDLVLLALHVFVVHSKTSLEAKRRRLLKLLSRAQATQDLAANVCRWHRSCSIRFPGYHVAAAVWTVWALCVSSVRAAACTGAIDYSESPQTIAKSKAANMCVGCRLGCSGPCGAVRSQTVPCAT